jgi:hypothetical protein
VISSQTEFLLYSEVKFELGSSHIGRMASSGKLRRMALVRNDVSEEISPFLHQGDKNR